MKDNLLGIPDPTNAIPPKTPVSDVPEELVLSEIQKKNRGEKARECRLCHCRHFVRDRCRHCGKARQK